MRHQKVLPLLTALALLGCGAPVATSSSSPAPTATPAPVKFEAAAFSFLRPQAWQEEKSDKALVKFSGQAGLMASIGSYDAAGISSLRELQESEERYAKKDDKTTLKISELLVVGGADAYRIVKDWKYETNPSRSGFCYIDRAGTRYTLYWTFKYQDPAAAQAEKDIQALLDSWTWK